MIWYLDSSRQNSWKTLSFSNPYAHTHQKLISNQLYRSNKTIVQVWKTLIIYCLKIFHSTNSKNDKQIGFTTLSQLQAAVNQIIFEASQDPLLQALVENIDTEQIMTQPTCRIPQRVTNSYNHMQAHSKAVKLQARLRTHDIRHYFPLRTSQISTDKNLLRPP